MANVTGRMSAKSAARRAAAEDKRGRAAFDATRAELPPHSMFTSDSFENLALKLGIGTDNLLSQSTYGYYPVTRIRVLLEWIHRGSWLGGIAVDVVADDMVRAGIEITSTMAPDQVKALDQALIRCGVWSGVNETVKWGRLYGGSVGYIVIDGQDPTTALRIDAVAKGQFKGLMVFDRWMVNPSLEKLVFDPLWGWVPEYYDTMAGYAMGVPRIKFHHSRCIRMEGIRLPWQQRLTENTWGLSVYERMYDRMVAFDSGTMGVAQSLYKAYLRYMKVKDFKSVAATSGPALEGMAKYINLIRKYQSIEGMTIIDAEDEFGTHQNQTFTGMSDGLLQLGQQLAGALQIPMVRLFGQSPAGLNATGESDLRTYYDGINAQQEKVLRNPLDTILRVVAKSEGIKLPKDFDFLFRPLWQMTPREKAETAKVVEGAVSDAYQHGMISQRTAMAELQQGSHATGIFTNITPDDLAAAEALIPTSLGGVDPATGEVVQPAEDEIAPAPSGGKANGAASPKSKPGGKTKKNGKANGAQKSADALPFTILGQRSFNGIDCVVQQPPDFDRRNQPCPGASPYGFILRTEGMDGDGIDVFFGPNEVAPQVWVINQGEFDAEHKVMLGYDRWGDALRAYCLAYPDYPPPRDVAGMLIDEFKKWLANPSNHGKPACEAAE